MSVSLCPFRERGIERDREKRRRGIERGERDREKRREKVRGGDREGEKEKEREGGTETVEPKIW